MGVRQDAATAFEGRTLDYDSLVGQMEQDRGLPLVQFGGTEEGRQPGIRIVACDGGDVGGNQDRKAFLEQAV